MLTWHECVCCCQVADEDRQALQRWAAKLDEDQLELEEQKRALTVRILHTHMHAGGTQERKEGGGGMWYSPQINRSIRFLGRRMMWNVYFLVPDCLLEKWSTPFSYVLIRNPYIQ